MHVKYVLVRVFVFERVLEVWTWVVVLIMVAQVKLIFACESVFGFILTQIHVMHCGNFTLAMKTSFLREGASSSDTAKRGQST